MFDEKCTTPNLLYTPGKLSKGPKFEKELKSIWVAIDDRAKRLEERVSKIKDKVDGDDIGAALLASRIEDLGKAKASLGDELTYLKSQSMQHLHDALKLAKETVSGIRFERVHRSPGQPVPGRVRTIVAKFTYFQDRELLRKQWKSLAAKRLKLGPKLKAARDEGKRAWIVYDTLYVDGRRSKELERDCLEGFGKRDCIEGSGKRDCLEGLDKRDCIEGLGKRDCIEGLGKRDCLEGLGKRACIEGLGKRDCLEGLGKRDCVEGLGKRLGKRDCLEWLGKRDCLEGLGKKRVRIALKDSARGGLP
ncbi:hypothetical protein DPMN_066792 [Dreissena polymorpha]|uniref:Uncharacterized protein n=1 Tax=Dreissena polymorpha TaxID=45954 RepID=A0A9D4BT55_DREPO|nr:hypothetical protein DPMN_066792 [Dreissena polymorpha]